MSSRQCCFICFRAAAVIGVAAALEDIKVEWLSMEP